MKTKLVYSVVAAFLLFVTLITAGKAQQGITPDNNGIRRSSNNFNPGQLNPNAPPETEQYGQLAGVWEAEQAVINPDGTWPEKTTRAEWRWYYILDGHAIQDDWFSLETTADSSQELQPVGTNIRIYNPGDKKWHMAWIDKTNRRLAIFTAVQQDGKIIMSGTNAKGREIRNTFFNITGKAFDWQQEWTFDQGKSWVVVTKIHCRRKS